MLDVTRFLKQNGMNKRQLAEKAGLKQANLYSGLRNPTLATIKRIAEDLNVTPSELLYDQEDLKPRTTRGRSSRLSRTKLNAIVICGDKHYEASTLKELVNLCRNLKKIDANSTEE